MRILVACERSGAVRRALRARGHDAISCDLEPADDGGEHIQGDAIEELGRSWDMVLAFPPCTYLSVSGLHWNVRRPERAELTARAAQFFLAFTSLSCPWAIENPIGCMNRLYRRPDQILQPYDFGDDASKATCLWLNGLPRLTPTRRVGGRMVGGRERWANQTDSGQNRLTPAPDRAARRALTFPGVAAAMAEQWTAAL